MHCLTQWALFLLSLTDYYCFSSQASVDVSSSRLSVFLIFELSTELKQSFSLYVSVLKGKNALAKVSSELEAERITSQMVLTSLEEARDSRIPSVSIHRYSNSLSGRLNACRVAHTFTSDAKQFHSLHFSQSKNAMPS